MNPPMDDRRILAEMERRLARDDPDLASLMDALNGQFPTGPDDDRNDDGDRQDRHDWHWKAAMVLAIVAVVAMILTAILTRPPSPDDNKGPPNGLAPAVSVLTQRRAPPRTAPGRRPGPAVMGQLAHPPHARQGRLMRARDLAESYTSVRNDADAVKAVRLLVEQQLPGLLVVDAASCTRLRAGGSRAGRCGRRGACRPPGRAPWAYGRRLLPGGQAVSAHCRSRQHSRGARGADGSYSKSARRRCRAA